MAKKKRLNTPAQNRGLFKLKYRLQKEWEESHCTKCGDELTKNGLCLTCHGAPPNCRGCGANEVGARGLCPDCEEHYPWLSDDGFDEEDMYDTASIDYEEIWDID